VAFTDFREPFGGASYSNLGKGQIMKRISAPLALVICCTFIMSCTGSARARSNSRRRTRTRPCSSSNFPDRWSAAECIEHIAAAEDYIRGMIIEKVMAAPAAPNRDVAKIDAGIIANVPEP